VFIYLEWLAIKWLNDMRCMRKKTVRNNIVLTTELKKIRTSNEIHGLQKVVIEAHSFAQDGVLYGDQSDKSSQDQLNQ
jgi:hypothetical protein